MLFITTILISLTSCNRAGSSPEYASIITFANEHAEEEGWKLNSIGAFRYKGYSGPGFNIVYRGRAVFEIEEARNIMVRNILKFVEQHSNNKKLIEKVDLKNNEFSYRNIELGISLYAEHYKRGDGTICLIGFNENRIRYWRYDAAQDDLILVHSEPINEALRLSPECIDKSIIYEDPVYDTATPPQTIKIIEVR